MRPTGDHFYTTSAQEREAAIVAAGYVLEGIGFWVPVLPDPQRPTPLFRLANPNSGDHFYTTSAQERDGAIAGGDYVDEGVACHVFAAAGAGTTPLFRLFNDGNGDHFYTTSAQERDGAVAGAGYVNEGVACHVFAAAGAGTTPLFRLLNPNSGDHFYTTSAQERNNAVLNRLALLTTPPSVITINQMVESMQQTYSQIGILVEVGSRENLSRPSLANIQAGTAEQGELFANRDSVGVNDVAAYMVESALSSDGDVVNGFAPLGQPSAVISSIASRWTLAHEVGHSLNLNHISGEDTNCPVPGPTHCCNTPDFTRLMTGCGTRGIINPPPDLSADEVEIMDSRVQTVDL
jgi:hypothetical protein